MGRFLRSSVSPAELSKASQNGLCSHQKAAQCCSSQQSAALVLFWWKQVGIHQEQARAISDTEDRRHKSIEKNNFFLFTKKNPNIGCCKQNSQSVPSRVCFPSALFLSLTTPIVKMFQKSNPRSSLLQQDALQKATVVRKSEGKQICTDSYRLQEPAVLQPSCLEICRLFFFPFLFFYYLFS